MPRRRLKQMRTFEHLRDIQGELLAALLLCCDIRIPVDQVEPIILPVEFYLTFRLLSRACYDSFAQSVHTTQLCFIKLYRALFRLPSCAPISNGWSRCSCGARIKHKNFGYHLRKCALRIDLDAQECCYIEWQAQEFERATLCDRRVSGPFRSDRTLTRRHLKKWRPQSYTFYIEAFFGVGFTWALAFCTYQFLKS